MRILRLTLEEVLKDPVLDTCICYRAERVITATKLRSAKHLRDILKLTVEDLDKTLNQEIQKHETVSTPRPAVCAPPNPEAASVNNEAPGVGR